MAVTSMIFLVIAEHLRESLQRGVGLRFDLGQAEAEYVVMLGHAINMKNSSTGRQSSKDYAGPTISIRDALPDVDDQPREVIGMATD